MKLGAIYSVCLRLPNSQALTICSEIDQIIDDDEFLLSENEFEAVDSDFIDTVSNEANVRTIFLWE